MKKLQVMGVFDFGNLDFSFDLKQTPKTKDASIEEMVVQSKAQKRFVKNEERHFLAAKALGDLCDEPLEGEQWRILTEKAFNAYAFICHLLERGNIDELWLAIYRINESTVTSITQMIDDGRIKRANFIISSFFNQTKKPEKWALQLADYCAKNERTRFVYLHNHSKVVCAKRGDAYFVFEGSGNMSDNARIEQYLYERSQLTYNFYASEFDKLITEIERKRLQE